MMIVIEYISRAYRAANFSPSLEKMPSDTVTSLIIHIPAKPLNAAAHLLVKHLQKSAVFMDSQFSSCRSDFVMF